MVAGRPRVPRPALFVPGMLIAATGVGAGDLLTASLAGSRFGLTLLWAAWVGAVLKWFLNEGIARWQMATGTTLVEGWIARLGRWVRWAFGAYIVAIRGKTIFWMASLKTSLPRYPVLPCSL